MHPEKRIYLVQTMPMTEAAIDAGLTRDLFVALGEDLGKGAWSLRIYHKPFVRWLWLGGLIMALGGGIAASDRALPHAGAARAARPTTAPRGRAHEPCSRSTRGVSRPGRPVLVRAGQDERGRVQPARRTRPSSSAAPPRHSNCPT